MCNINYLKDWHHKYSIEVNVTICVQVLEHCDKHRACIFLVIVFSQALSYFRWDEWIFFCCTVSQHLKHFRTVYDNIQSLLRRKSPPQ